MIIGIMIFALVVGAFVVISRDIRPPTEGYSKPTWDRKHPKLAARRHHVDR